MEGVGCVDAMSFCSSNINILAKDLDEITRLLYVGNIYLLAINGTFLDNSTAICCVNIEVYYFGHFDKTFESG